MIKGQEVQETKDLKNGKCCIYKHVYTQINKINKINACREYIESHEDFAVHK